MGRFLRTLKPAAAEEFPSKGLATPTASSLTSSPAESALGAPSTDGSVHMLPMSVVEGVPVESVPVAVGTPSPPPEPASGVRFLLDVRVDTRYLSVLSFLVWWAVRFALWASVAVPVALLGTVPVALRSFFATLYEQYYRPYEPYYRPPSRSSYDPWSPPKIVAARRPTVMGGAIELDRPVGRGSIVAVVSHAPEPLLSPNARCHNGASWMDIE